MIKSWHDECGEIFRAGAPLRPRCFQITLMRSFKNFAQARHKQLEYLLPYPFLRHAMIKSWHDECGWIFQAPQWAASGGKTASHMPDHSS